MKRIKKPVLDDISLRELDKLVAAEIDALQKQAGYRPPGADRGPMTPPPREPAAGRVTPFSRQRASGPGRGGAEPPSWAGEPPGPAGEEGLTPPVGEAAAAARPDSFGPYPEPDLPETPPLLTEEEERFIANIVGWLKPKENKDIIVARIWTRLTESEPEAFYTPELQAMPAGEPAAGKERPSETGE